MSSVPTRVPAATLLNLSTPCLVLDRDVLARNLARMSDQMAARRVRLRPHLKTAKCAEIARMAGGPSTPITVSTLREAEYFAHHGWTDIFYAVAIGPGKVARAARLVRDGVRLVVMVDHPDAAAALVAGAAEAGVTFRSVIEIDSGDRRSGLPPADPLLPALAAQLGVHFAGIATHAGNSYQARTPEDLTTVATSEAAAVRFAARRLAAAGRPCRIVSIGSSPTAFAQNVDLEGITELRAGVYMFWDLYQAGLGLCGVSDIAASVLTEVIGRPAHRPNEFLIDAGAFALSKDTSTAALGADKDAGYGWICDLEGRHLPGMRVARVWQEHGLVVCEQPLAADQLQIGTRLRVLPNHACPTAAAHDRYFVVSRNSPAVAEWPRVNGW